MPYFVKGKPSISKPTSLLGKTLQVTAQQQQMRMQEKRDRQRMMLQAAQLKMQQERDQQRLAVEQMKFRNSENRRLDTQEQGFQRELRRVTDVNLEPWAQSAFEEVINGQMLAAKNFRGSAEDASAAIRNIMTFRRQLEKDQNSRKQLDAFNDLLDPVEQQAQNKKLKDNFQQINSDALTNKVEQANFLYDGGFMTNMHVLGAGDLSMAPQLVGNEFTGFDENGNPQYSDKLSEVVKSPYYHDQGKTGYMVTPMSPFFGKSFTDIGVDVQTDLKREADNGPWNEDAANTFVGDLLRTPFGVRARQWRMRSLLGDVTGPEANEQSDGIYYKYADEPELRDKLMKMVVDYDISDANGLKPLYLEYRTVIDAAIDLAQRKIVAASDFDNYQAPLRGGNSPDNPRVPFDQQMINYRAPIIEPETEAIGSLYTPYFLRQNQQKVGVDNSAAVEAWDAERSTAVNTKTDENIERGMSPVAALQRAKAEIDKLYKPSDRPKETLRIPIRRLGVFPDATGSDGQALLFLYDDDGNRYPIQGGTQAYADIEAEIRGKTFDNVTMATLLNDMDKRWAFTDEQLNAVRPQQTEPQAEPAPQQTTSSFPSYPEWKQNNPDGTVSDWRAAKAAAQ